MLLQGIRTVMIFDQSVTDKITSGKPNTVAQ